MKSEWFTSSEQFQSLPSDHIYYHLNTQSIVQSTLTKVPSKDYQTIYHLAEWRFLSQYPIIKIYHANLHREMREGVWLNVYFQKLDQLLEAMVDITLKQALYLFKTSLIALDKLKDKFGCFDFNAQMIGVNSKKQCKKCQILRKCQNEQEMVKKLISLIQQHTLNTPQNLHFFQLASSSCSSFIKAQEFISLYSYQYNFVIPPFFITEQPHRINYSINSNCHLGSFRSFRKSSPNTPSNPKISFKYINYKDINNKQFMLKDSKNTMACSSDSDLKSNNKLDLNIISSLKNKLSISLTEKNLTKMTINSSTVNLQIHHPQPKYTSEKQAIENYAKKVIQQGFEKNQWRRNIEELFECSKKIKDSINYSDQNQISSIPSLKILSQYGRYVQTTTQEKDQSTYKLLK